jgi:Rieske Fe-S protein
LKKDKNSRRFFIKALGVGIGTACLGMWGSMVNIQQKNTGKKTISISLKDNREVIFHDECIIINMEQPLVFSSYCTHLGCRIQNFENGQLICPCHGSSFDLNGKPQKGPAIKPLQELEFKLNPETKTLTINI